MKNYNDKNKNKNKNKKIRNIMIRKIYKYVKRIYILLII